MAYIKAHSNSFKDNLEEAVVVTYGLHGFGYIREIDLQNGITFKIKILFGPEGRLSIESPISCGLEKMKLARWQALQKITSDGRISYTARILARKVISGNSISAEDFMGGLPEELLDWQKIKTLKKKGFLKDEIAYIMYIFLKDFETQRELGRQVGPLSLYKLFSIIFPVVFLPGLFPSLVLPAASLTLLTMSSGPVLPFLADQRRFVPAWLPMIKTMVVNAKMRIREMVGKVQVQFRLVKKSLPLLLTFGATGITPGAGGKGQEDPEPSKLPISIKEALEYVFNRLKEIKLSEKGVPAAPEKLEDGSVRIRFTRKIKFRRGRELNEAGEIKASSSEDGLSLAFTTSSGTRTGKKVKFNRSLEEIKSEVDKILGVWLEG
ncbi:MAG: hypothetical protein Q8N61_03025, partial [bacterium]|nr:hypothetical protein [bacterium]